jgi:hypothetical protein
MAATLTAPASAVAIPAAHLVALFIIFLYSRRPARQTSAAEANYYGEKSGLPGFRNPHRRHQHIRFAVQKQLALYHLKRRAESPKISEKFCKGYAESVMRTAR